MDSAPRKFPFPTSFQFRDDERAGLEALFERTFFDIPFSAGARQSLLRTCFQRGEGPGHGEEAPRGAAAPPAAPDGGSAGGASMPAACAYPGDAPRFILLYRGADGIGKTRVFRQFRESARKKEIPVYEVYHHDVEGIPFKPFLHAIREILRDHDRGAALQEKYAYGLRAILPELYDSSGLQGPRDDADRGAGAAEHPWSSGTPSFDEASKVRVFDAITQLLLEVTAKKPLLILVHDLHWSDRPTIELLDYIGRNLQLRWQHGAGAAPDGLVWGAPPAEGGPGLGPEFDDLESEEWRAFTKASHQPLDLLGVSYYAYPPLARRAPADSPRRAAQPDRAGSGQAEGSPSMEGPGAREGESAAAQQTITGAGIASPEDEERLAWSSPPDEVALDTAADPQPPSGPADGHPIASQEGGTVPRQAAGPRLMVLANYRGFADPSHYLEQGLRALGEHSFSYHGELRPLTRVEADRFVGKCVERVELNGRPFALPADAVEAIFAATEGFPSFMQELLRAMYLGEGGFASGGGVPPSFDGTAVNSALAAHAAPPLPNAVPPEEAISLPAKRHAILRLRLARATPDEQTVLRVMALARRPVRPGLITDVQRSILAAEGETGDMDPLETRLLDAFRSLEEKGIIERQEPASRRENGDGAYFFRLWDYTTVVEQTIAAEEGKRLHQLLGEEYRLRLASGNDEAAFEIYYHLSRGLEPRSAVSVGLLAASRLVRLFALVKARSVYDRLAELLSAPDDQDARVQLLETSARISLALRDFGVAEETLRRAQIEELSPERRVELILLESEAAGARDPGKGLKILGKAGKHIKDENTRLGVRIQHHAARLRLERQDIKRAINFALKGTSICQKVGDVPELGDLYRTMASAFYRKGDYSHAVDNYQRALDAFERTGLKDASVDTLDELGRVYLERGNHFRAARYLYKSLEIRRRQHDLPGLCHCYDELGRVYLRSGDYLKTIENLNRSLALKERIGDFAGLNPTLVILGDLYFRIGRYEQALAYFRREVENSQKLGDTRGLAEAFAQLGRVHFELGDIKQAESHSKQVSILGTEFKLRSQEADGALLEGSLRALVRDWVGAEKSFKFAAEVHGKLGHRRREASAYLDLAGIKLARELYDEALKFQARGQLIADEVKAKDLQVRALTIKGNIHRSLKGGNMEKVRECLHKALELSQGLSDASTLFYLYYSLAKVGHSEREFAEAANYYGKAELILKQTGEALSEDRAARFFEDRRRKVFAEDVARFRKDTLGRASGPAADQRVEQPPAAAAMDRPVGLADYKDLLARVIRVHEGLNQLHFHDRILKEAVELAGADRGFIVRVQNRQYLPMAFHGFGKAAAEHPEFQVASAIAQDVIRRGRSFLVSGGGEIGGGAAGQEARNGKAERASFLPASLNHLSVLAVPFMTEERIFGGVYLDKPVVVGQFLSRSQMLLEAFAQHAAVAFGNRKELETAVREPLTGFYTPSYFVERLREAYRWFNLHGKSFTVVGFYLPALEDALGGGGGELAQGLATDLVGMLPHDAAVCWGSPILSILLGEADLAAQDELAARVRERLVAVAGEDVPMVALPAHNRYHQGSEIYYEARRRLLPEATERKAVTELQAILAKDVKLRDAKKILEKHKIESTLRKTGGNITHAARELGIHRPQLSNLLKKYALKREVYEEEVDCVEGLDGEPGPGEN